MTQLNTPLVSILVPLYNHEQYIIQCLDSIRDEGWKNIELVVHDDRSTDRSWELLNKWLTDNHTAFSNVITEQASRNRGVVGSLNRLLELAHGDYLVSPLASDDALLPNSIAARVAALESRPDWLAVFGDATPIDGSNRQITDSYMFSHFRSRKKHLVSDHKRRMEMIVRWSVPGPVILYRSKAFDPIKGVGKYNDSLCIEDRDMYLRLLDNNQLGFIDQKVALYRLHDKNTMRSPKIKIQSMVDRAFPLAQLSKSQNLSATERFVASHTAQALLAHANRRSTQGWKKTYFSWIRICHTLVARSVAQFFFVLKQS